METNLFKYIWRISRREQIAVLVLILLSLPFYFASLDIPKRIVNDALQGRAFPGGAQTAHLFAFDLGLPAWAGGLRIVSFPGFELEQLGYLLALSFAFLALVLVNGAFKLFINVRKGVLGEQILKRLRFDLFALMLRFRPEDVRTVKPAEAASMIKDEVEPIGGFAGDAFIQPFFLGTQALTALAFILLQNVWLGLIALAVVLVQALLIPQLRRRQIALGRQRQIESRRLSGQIGSSVEAAPVIHVHGAVSHSLGLVERQLDKLLGIRIALFKRKFAVKYLNNLLAQVTPFFFYAIGGYFALRGQLDLGQLIAVIGAYRDLPPPIKELIDWDQQRNDIAVKYEQVVGQFSDKLLLPEAAEEAEPDGIAEPAVQLQSLQVIDQHGTRLLEPLTATIPFASHVALVGPPGGGRDALARALGRQITEIKGEIRIGGHSINGLSSAALSRLMTYVGSDPGLMPGSIRENVVLAVQADRSRGAANGSAEPSGDNPADLSVEERREWYDRRITDSLELVGMREDLYRFGLFSTIGPDEDRHTLDRLVEARQRVRDELERRGLLRRIQPFDPDRYNANATIGENLLFGVPISHEWTDTEIGRNPTLLAALRAAGIDGELFDIGVKVAATTMEMIADLPPSHPLLERYSLIAPQDMDEVRKQLEALTSSLGRRRALQAGRGRFLGLALRYSEERHRFGLVSDAVEASIVAARHHLRKLIDARHPGAVEHFDPAAYTRAAPVRDNLLFGRAGFGLPQTEQQIWDIVRDILVELDLDGTVRRLGLNFDVGPSGKLLSGPQRAAVNLARCLVKQTPILIVEGALGAFPASEQARILDSLRRHAKGRTLIVALGEAAEARGYDRVFSFNSDKAATAVELAVAS